MRRMGLGRCFPLLVFLSLLAVLALTALGQPEPSSPEEEWYPPVGAPERPSGITPFLSTAGEGVPGAAGTVSMQIVDEGGRVRREQYGSERICLQFVSPYSRFYMFLYEWYPPGTYPRGHWLIYGAGPYSVWVGAVIRVCYFSPEPGEPEGQHTWKLWLYDPTTRSWSTGVYRFNYYAFPRAVIERVEYPPEIFVGGSYELRVVVRNLGEVDYTYSLQAEASGMALDQVQRSVRVPASSTAHVSFRVTVHGTAPRVELKLSGDGRVLDSKTISLTARVLAPGPMALGDVSPVVLREGEEVQLVFTFVNKGQGRAENVYARIEAPGFQLISGLEALPSIEGGSAARASFRVRPVEGGVRTVRLVVEYADIAGNKYSSTIDTTVTVLVRLQVEARGKGGSTLSLPILVDGKEYTRYDDWVNPTQAVVLEARGEVLVGDTRYVFVGWSDGATTARRTVSLTRSGAVSAIYAVYYFVSAQTPYGRVLGEGWYEEGSTATVSVDPVSVGFGIKQVFDHWEDERGRVLSSSPSYSFVVRQPVSLRAVWRTDYSELVLVAGLIIAVLAALAFASRVRRPPPPPPPPPP